MTVFYTRIRLNPTAFPAVECRVKIGHYQAIPNPHKFLIYHLPRQRLSVSFTLGADGREIKQQSTGM